MPWCRRDQAPRCIVFDPLEGREAAIVADLTPRPRAPAKPEPANRIAEE
jgi:hypothetical protein